MSWHYTFDSDQRNYLERSSLIDFHLVKVSSSLLNFDDDAQSHAGAHRRKFYSAEFSSQILNLFATWQRVSLIDRFVECEIRRVTVISAKYLFSHVLNELE